MRDHPDIRKMENEGVEYGDAYYCPICGEAAETIYKDTWGNVVGCDNCIITYSAEEMLDE